MAYKCKSPILFLSFNRLDTTKQVIKKVLEVKPDRIYLASDGPRKNKLDSNGISEETKVDEVRTFLLDSFNDDFIVKTRFLETNHGCKYAVSGAISWFFENEKSGIILEDDCLPNESFFKFCDEMLEKYMDNEKIFIISGWSNLDFDLKSKNNLKESYFFSKYSHIWGWASFARAWQKYELENPNFDNDYEKLEFDSKKEKREFKKVMGAYFRGEIDTWDYPWSFTIWKHNGLCVYPKFNTIKNIGFDREDATHTTGKSKFQNIEVYDIAFPLQHPKEVKRNKALDMANYNIIAMPNMLARIKNKITKILLG